MAEHDRRVYWQMVVRCLSHANPPLKKPDGSALDWETIQVLAELRGNYRHVNSPSIMADAVRGIFFPHSHT